MSDRLTPIPTPPAQLWRQVRLQYIPVVIFIAGVAAAAFLWIHWVAPPTFVGEAEALRAELRSSQAGALAGLELSVLQPVTAGQLIGHVVVNDPRLLESSLAALRAEIEMIRTTMDPVVGRQRAALDFERLQLDLMGKRVDLATYRGGLFQAETTLARNTTLHRSKIITDDEYELSKNARDILVAQIQALSDLIGRLEPSITRMGAAGAGQDATIEGLNAAIKHKEAELQLVEAQLRPLSLVAPIDGVVTMIFRRAGETVAAGEPILQITATRVERIVGYLRPPLPTLPETGTTVEVRTRTLQRKIASASIVAVGQQFEPITPGLLSAMRLPVTPTPTEYGLRVHVSVPPGFSLRPGEHVDLVVLD